MKKNAEVSKVSRKPQNIIATLQQENQQLKQENQRLRELTLLDPLTEIGNRRYLEQSLQQEYNHALRHSLTLGFLLLDLDRFKRYNDTFGHLAGDRLLVKVALAFKELLHRPKDMLFRYGGEEFACLLPHTNGDGVSNIGQKLLETARICGITVSIGAVCADVRKLNGSQELIAIADRAMYRAKNRGRDRMIVVNS